MKTESFKRQRPVLRQSAARRWQRGRLLLAILLLAAARLQALPTVSTISGGPTSGNPAYFGNSDGQSDADAQYHTPIGLALGNDPLAGSILYVADRDNNAI